MPNWCYNDEYIYGPKKDIENLYEKLVEWIKPIPKLVEKAKKDKRRADYDNWLGNIFTNAGFDTNDPEFYCRGWLTCDFSLSDFDEDVSIIEFGSETAWGSIYESWDAFLKKVAPSCTYGFLSEECGMAFYAKRDPFGMFEDFDWYIDTCINQPDKCPNIILDRRCDCLRDDELNYILSDVLHMEGTTEVLLKEFNKNVEAGLYGKDNHFYIHKYEIIE